MKDIEKDFGISWMSLALDIFNHVLLNDKRIQFFYIVCTEMVRTFALVKLEGDIVHP